MRGSAAPGFAPGFAAALAVLLVGLVAALALGRFPVFPLDLGRLLLAKLTGSASGLPPAVETVVWSIRGPRILAAVLVGGGLAVAGAAFQGLFRNPLVSPDLLGASSGAALGAVANDGARFIGGGTNLLDLMKAGVEHPGKLVDINSLPLKGVEERDGGLRQLRRPVHEDDERRRRGQARHRGDRGRVLLRVVVGARLGPGGEAHQHRAGRVDGVEPGAEDEGAGRRLPRVRDLADGEGGEAEPGAVQGGAALALRDLHLEAVQPRGEQLGLRRLAPPHAPADIGLQRAGVAQPRLHAGQFDLGEGHRRQPLAHFAGDDQALRFLLGGEPVEVGVCGTDAGGALAGQPEWRRDGQLELAPAAAIVEPIGDEAAARRRRTRRDAARRGRARRGGSLPARYARQLRAARPGKLDHASQALGSLNRRKGGRGRHRPRGG